MTPTEQIKAIAELDGFVKCERKGYEGYWMPLDYVYGKSAYNKLKKFEELPLYLTSRDAIIPVIEKQLCKIESSNLERYDRFGKELSTLALGYTSITIDYAEAFIVFMKATPQQLCEALLRAVGKWKD